MAPCSKSTCFGSTTALIATVLLIFFGSFTSFGFASLHDNNSNAARSVLESHHHSRRLGCVCDAECDRIQEEDCLWGLTLDVCGCCLVCSRGEGEPCGGALGSCSHQLYCVAGPAGAPSSDGGEEDEEGRTCSAQAPPSSDCKDDEGERFGCYFSGGNCLCRNFSSCHELDYFLFDTQEACHSRIELLTANSGGHALIDRERDKTGEDGHGGGCSRVKCPQALDCPSDSYRLPTNFHPDSDECCPAVNKCQCNPVIECPKPECPPDWTSQLVLNATGEPGRCCPILECSPNKSLGTKQRCNYLGTQYNQGDSWTHLEDCTECSCTGKGVVSCQRIKCDLPAQCLMARAPPGSCCPVCAGCTTSEGKVYNNSDIWEEDACTLCECDEGRVKCHATMCQSQCENPIYLPGECCPRCVESAEDGVMVKDCGEEEMVNCNKNCPYGFVRNEKVCPHCECNKCPPHSPCHLKCPQGYEMDELGCPICSCRWSRSEVSDRGRPPQWMTENNNKNRDKKRSKNRVNKASLRSGSPKNKVNTFVGEGVGGKTCKWTDGRDEIVRLDGEEWSDGCRECVCKFGREFCTLISCSPPECEHPIFYPGGCCPRCPDEEWDHVHSNVTICPGSGSNKPAHLEGEQWELTPCLKCTCHRGLTLCATQTCPPAPCQTSDLETPPIGSCCPKCKPGLGNKEPESTIMQARVSEMRSVPLRGTLKVDVGGRRTTAVMSALRKNCFSDDLQLKYADGEAWKVGPCQSCICQDGRIECFSSSGNCPRLDCQRPALAKNQCCPMCLDDDDGKVRVEMNCSSVSGSGKNDTWLHGQSWMADKCTRCVCNAPLVQCTRIICSISCRKPLLYVEDECCPICPPDEDQLLKGHGILEPYCTVIIIVLFCLTTLLGLYVLTSIYQQRRGRQRLSSSSFNSKPSSSSASSCSSEDDSGYYKAATTSCCRKTKNKYVPAATSASQVSRSSSNNSCHRHHGHQECSGGENCGETEEKLLCPNNV